LFSNRHSVFGIQAGHIRIFGHDIQHEPGEALRCMGVVFQPRTLDLDLSVTQNLLYQCRAARHQSTRARMRSEEALSRMGLADRLGSKGA